MREIRPATRWTGVLLSLLVAGAALLQPTLAARAAQVAGSTPISVPMDARNGLMTLGSEGSQLIRLVEDIVRSAADDRERSGDAGLAVRVDRPGMHSRCCAVWLCPQREPGAVCEHGPHTPRAPPAVRI